MESWLWTQKEDIGPAPRYASSMVYDSSLKRVVMFAGSDTNYNWLKDTWQLNGTEWTQIADTGPSGRAAHQMAYVIETRKIILFGGYSMSNGSEQLYGDTWEWDG